MPSSAENKRQTAVGLAVSGLGVGMGVGAWSIPSEAGYAGVGPNFLPWVVSVALLVLGVFLIREAVTGGFRSMESDEQPAPPCVTGFMWISAGLLVNAALITSVGFILGCGLCFMLSAQGLRKSVQAGGGAARGADSLFVRLGKDLLIGVAVAAPVYWMFTKLLAIKLPGLTATGWI
jgi:putative tricarboxylic transport membrane protein